LVCLASTVRSIDPGFLARSAAESRKISVLREIAVDEVYLGKQQKLITVDDDLELTAPVVVRWGAEARSPQGV
jgi:hypothetical protein